MNTDDIRTLLRQSLATGNGDLAIRALTADLDGETLQLAGDALLLAIHQDVESARPPAMRCVAMLRERCWRGDDELVNQLNAALGVAPARLLRPLPVDLEDLAIALEGDPAHTGGVIDLESGEVWHAPAVEYAIEIGEHEAEDFEEDRWLAIECNGSGDGFADMADFTDTVDDKPFAGQLDRALSGPRPFRRFKDALAGSPDELDRWYGYSDDRQRGRAREWLADAGYYPNFKPA